MLAACGGSGKVENEQFAFLDNQGITINDELMLGDSLTLPDVYCGDPEQTLDDLKGETLTREQYHALVVPAGGSFASAMSNWLLLGVRDVGNGNTLAAFYGCNGLGYCVDLMTYDRQGKMPSMRASCIWCGAATSLTLMMTIPSPLTAISLSRVPIV